MIGHRPVDPLAVSSDDFSDIPLESFDQDNASDEWTYVDIDTFEATF